MANLSAKTGFTPVQTRVTLANNATTSVQEFAAYDGQELTGFVFIDATTDYRATVNIQVVKNGAGVYEVAAADIAGDDIGGNPIVSFSMSGSVLRATLVSYAGFVSAFIQYNLNAPVLGANFPLTVDSSNVAFATIKASTGSGITFQEDGGTSVGSFSDAGAWTLGPNAGITQDHGFNGRSVSYTAPNAATTIFHNYTNSALRAQVGVNGSAGKIISGGITNAYTIASTAGIEFGDLANNIWGNVQAGAWTFGITGVQNRFSGGSDTTVEASSVVRFRNIGAPNGSTGAALLSFMDVNGDVQGSITINPSANTTSFNTSSDKRLKTDFQDFNGIQMIQKMNPSNYERVSALGVKEYGLVAQELFETYPQAVVVGGDDPNSDPWSIDYSKIVPILIKSIQELKAEIDILKGSK